MLQNSIWWWVPATPYGTHSHCEMVDTWSTNTPAVYTSKLCWSPCSTGWSVMHLRWYLYKKDTRHENRAKHKTLGAVILNHFWEKRGGLGEFLKEKSGGADSHPEQCPFFLVLSGIHLLSGLKQVLWNTQELGMISNPGMNIKYSSWFPKDSLHQHFGNYFTLSIYMVLFSDLPPWTIRADQEQQWAFCL